ncbi:hypothetical protein BJX61DRAFT_303168 [Aspergillus egyptiacus]|nr:hypothetical protein BJX61DRAFT_303168 [Aspergillus egyptiacus]
MRPQIYGSVAALGCISFAAANDIVSLILLPNPDPQDLVAEVVGSVGPMTTYVITCPDGTDSVDCGMPPDGMTAVAGPTAFVVDNRFEDYWLRYSCAHRSTTWFSCAMTQTQSDLSTQITETGSTGLSYIPVTVTATAKDAAVTTTAASQPTSKASETASATSDRGTEASAEPSETDNAAVAQVTGSPVQWLVSGAGMALALALA